MIKGQVLGGEYSQVIIRQKSEESLEIGELLVGASPEKSNEQILLQVYDLRYGSQISDTHLELISGMKLEENLPVEFMDPHLRNYTLALAKSLMSFSPTTCRTCKTLPAFFSEVKAVTKADLSFLTKPSQPLYLGNLRSGSHMLDVPIYLEGEKVLSEHILISASTGKGKSNLTRVLLWCNVDQDYTGLLVLDPHDEYYGRTALGLKDHPRKEKVVYYTPKNPPPGARTLVVNIESLKPQHFHGVMFWSDPQEEALQAYYRKYREHWISALIMEVEEQPTVIGFAPATLSVIKRRLLALLDLTKTNNEVYSNGVFDFHSGRSTVQDICEDLEQAHTVIIDTSQFSSQVEILLGSLLAHELFHRYKKYKLEGKLREKPVISIVLEEAPRVLGKDVLEKGHNIFSTLAREGRKFKVGLLAITQLPSLIPRSILANMNTKIILGLEMAPERQAIIESSAQDLTMDARAIASLDKGEAIVSSTFTRFAIPIKVPFFDDLVVQTPKPSVSFVGVKLGSD